MRSLRSLRSLRSPPPRESPRSPTSLCRRASGAIGVPSCSASSISHSASGCPSAPSTGPSDFASLALFEPPALALFAVVATAAGAATTGDGAVCSRIISIISSFFARAADFTPSAFAIATSCSRSFASSADCSRASLATMPSFRGTEFFVSQLAAKTQYAGAQIRLR